MKKRYILWWKEWCEMEKEMCDKTLKNCLCRINHIQFLDIFLNIFPGLVFALLLFMKLQLYKVKVKSLSRVRLCDPMNCSLPGSSIHGIFQARVLSKIYSSWIQWYTIISLKILYFSVLTFSFGSFL